MLTAFFLVSVTLNIYLLRKVMVHFTKFWIRKCRAFIKKQLVALGIKNTTYDERIKNYPVVYYANDINVHYLKSVTSSELVTELPEQLIMKPGVYLFHEQAYDLNQEGLYRFVDPEKKNYQRIVFSKDIKALLSSLSWIVTHGEEDDTASYVQLMHYAMHRKLLLTCESVSRFAMQLLSEFGIKARIVGGYTLEPWNTYNSGHYLLEVYDSNIRRWMLYDIDNDMSFSKEGHPLSLIEWFRALSTNSYTLCPLSSDIRAFPGKSVYRNDLTFLDEMRIADLKTWYQHTMQSFFIEDKREKKTYFKLDAAKQAQYPSWAFADLIFLTEENFNNEFYQEI